MRRFLITAVISTGFALPLAIAACGDDGADDESFDTYQDCYDDHTMEEMLPNKEAITVCCIDHPIAGSKNTFCKDTEADCEVALRAALDASITAAMITEGCTDYIDKRGQ